MRSVSAAQLLTGQLNTKAEFQLIVWRHHDMEISTHDPAETISSSLFLQRRQVSLQSYSEEGGKEKKEALKALLKSHSRHRECHSYRGLIGGTECGPSPFPITQDDRPEFGVPTITGPPQDLPVTGVVGLTCLLKSLLPKPAKQCQREMEGDSH